MQQAQHARGWNFLPKLTFVITIGLITAATGFQARAVDVFTDPVGFITLTAQGTTSSGLSFLGLGMTQIPTLRGVLTAASGKQLTLNSVLTNGQFSGGPLGPLFFIEVTSGPLTGLLDDIVSNDTANVYTANSDGLAGTENFKIYPHWTLSSVFGPNAESGLKKGTATTADQILVFNPMNQSYLAYFFSSGGAIGAGWRLGGGGSTDYSTERLYIDQGILIQKKTSTNLTIQLVGAVKLGQTIEYIGPTNNFVANVYASGTMTLSNSMLYNGGNVTNSLVGGTATTADQVLIHDDVGGGYSSYFWSNGGAIGAGWREGGQGATDESGTLIPLGATLLIERKAPRAGFNWFAPAPY